jgi:3-hydroxyacyl-CoA dehydrogenase/enoyl-CoA hydratase/3-hydroxybutyryl-CoA epimerase
MTTNATVSSVRYDVDTDGICALTIDVPGAPVNTFGAALINDLTAAIERVAADQSARGILLASGKDGFLAGADLKEINTGRGGDETAPLTVAEQIDRSMTLSRMLRRLETLGKPVAVVINGTAAGGGLELALAAHYRVVIDDPAIRLGLPESNVGLIPGGGGTQRLPRLIGIERALPLLLAGTLVRPDEALKAGFVDAVAPREQAVAEARRWLLETGDPLQPWDKKDFRLPGGLPAESPKVRQALSVSIGLTRAKTFGNIPAQEAIPAVVWEGTRLPFDTALRLEAKYFHRVFNHPTSRALIRTMFVSKHAADKLSMRPAGVPAASIRTLGIAGAGTMGAGLALAAARAGLDVLLLDVSQDKASAGRAYAGKRLDRDVQKGRTTPEKAAAVLGRIRPTADFAEFAIADFVIEAVFEDAEIKREVYGRIEEHLPAGVILASNTSALPVSRLAEATSRAESFIGMHFFSPAERMPLVEIIRGHRTSDSTLAHALDLARVLRKTPIVVNDSRGFFTSRFIGSFMGESLRMVSEGVLPPLVENGARMLGMPQGPLTVADAVGLDVGRKAGIEAVRGAPSGDLRHYGLPEVLVGKFDRYGRKNGKGFYTYAEDGSRILWAGLADLLPTLEQQPSIDEVKARILYAQLAEGARAFAEGVLLDVTGGDLGATLGVGFPAHLGGPFVAMDAIGIPQVVAELDRLRAAYGGQFAGPDLLREMAESGQTFYGANPVASPGAGGRVRSRELAGS